MLGHIAGAERPTLLFHCVSGVSRAPVTLGVCVSVCQSVCAFKGEGLR